MKTVIVTGGSGRLGKRVIKRLIQQGYGVLNLDQREPEPADALCPTYVADLTDYEAIAAKIAEGDAVIHLAAIPAPTIAPHADTFANNAAAAYNVLEAAARAGIRKVVMGSSESAYGLCWALSTFEPLYVPVDEDHPLLPQDCYSLSKAVGELTAETFVRGYGMQIVSLRFAYIVVQEDYEAWRSQSDDPLRLKLNLWSHVDVRDAAEACLCALEADVPGHTHLNITADDVLSDWDTQRLLQTYYPHVPYKGTPLQGREALYANGKAKRLLNWKPSYSWQSHSAADRGI